MKVKELIKELSKYDGEMRVFLSGDEEGNDFSLLSNVEYALYDMDAGYTIDIEEIYEYPNAEECILLWPM